MVRLTRSPAFSTPTRISALLIVLMLATAACERTTDVQPRTGDALYTEGMIAQGVTDNHSAKVDETWWFTLPPPYNVSDDPLEVIDASVVKVPDGIKIVRYRAYHRDDTDGMPLLAREGDQQNPDFARLKDYAKAPLKLAPDSGGDVYYVAELEVTAPPKENLRDCRFTYRQNGHTFTQTMGCELELRVG